LASFCKDVVSLDAVAGWSAGLYHWRWLTDPQSQLDGDTLVRLATELESRFAAFDLAAPATGEGRV
jgi:hypothetical protein